MTSQISGPCCDSDVKPDQDKSLVWESPGGRGGGGVLPYMGYIGMCRCEGYGFQAVYSRIGYINQSVWVYNRVSFFRKLISW